MLAPPPAPGHGTDTSVADGGAGLLECGTDGRSLAVVGAGGAAAADVPCKPRSGSTSSDTWPDGRPASPDGGGGSGGSAGTSDGITAAARADAAEPVPPFPWAPIVILSSGLVANALYITTLFPFLPFITADMTGIDDEREVGYRAGYVAGAFMIGRLLSSTVWGVWSDSHGRKPVLYAGCVTIAVTSIAFGLSFSYWWMLLVRFLGGVGNGITSTAKTCTSEVAHEAHQARAMSVITASWGLGLVLGPAIGGLTSRVHLSSWTPLRSLAPEGSFLRTYPYLLPNLIIAVAATVAFVSLRWLPESLDQRQRQRQRQRPQAGASAGDVVVSAVKRDEGGSEARPLAALRARGAKAEYVRVSVTAGDEDGGDSDGDSTVGGGGGTPSFAAAAETPGGFVGGAGPGSTGSTDGDSAGDLAGDAAVCGGGGDPPEDGIQLLPLDRRSPRGTLAVSPDPVDATDSSSATGTDGPRPASVYDRPLYKQPVVMTVILSYTLLSLVQIVFDEVFPLWAVVPVDKDGLGMDTTQIGAIMTAMGVLLLVFQVLVFPVIAKALGTRLTFIVAAFVSVPVMTLFPVVGYATTYAQRFAAIIVFACIKNGASVSAFTCMFLLTNNTVPARRRGAVNGFSMTVASAGKALAPVFAGNIFAWSMENGLSFPLDYHFVYILCGLMSLLLAYIGARMPVSLEHPIAE